MSDENPYVATKTNIIYHQNEFSPFSGPKKRISGQRFLHLLVHSTTIAKSLNLRIWVGSFGFWPIGIIPIGSMGLVYSAYIYHNFKPNDAKCRWIYHTWILRDLQKKMDWIKTRWARKNLRPCCRCVKEDIRLSGKLFELGKPRLGLWKQYRLMVQKSPAFTVCNV